MTQAAFRSRTYRSFDGLTLHYRDYAPHGGGEARATVLCLPGLTRNARDFEDTGVAIVDLAASTHAIG